MVAALLQSLRPKQWTKNLLVFAGYLFTIERGHPLSSLFDVVAAFALFCLVSGAGYVINDVADAGRDRKHPTKRKRPIAAGALPTGVAVPFAVVLAAAGIGASFALDFHFGLLISGYFVLSAAYSVFLKHEVIIDLLVIAAGFVIRAVAGAVVIDVAISSWLLVCTTLLALFLGLAKRRSELLTLEEGGLGHRGTLEHYTAPMLDQMLSVTASAALMAYCLYTFSPASATGAAHPYMMITIPFVIYGLMRYLFLVHTRNVGGSPELVLLEDKPMLINMVLYVIAAALALKL